MEQNILTMSNLSKTWFIDIDGTIVKHNGYKSGEDFFLEGSMNFLNNIPKNDKIVFTTARGIEYKEFTENFLLQNNIRYDHILYDLPTGERIVINDKKPNGLKMSYSINLERDEGMSSIKIIIDNGI